MSLSFRRFLLPLCSIGLLLLSLTADAKRDQTWSDVLLGRSSELVDNADMNTIEDDVSYNSTLLAYQDQLHRIQNAVYFMVDESDETGTYIQADFTCSLTVRINYTTISGTTTYVDKLLILHYKKDGGQIFDRMVSFQFEGAKRMQVKILSITGNVSWDYKKHLVLKEELTATRDYKFTCTNVPASLDHVSPGVSMPDELEVEWSVTSTHYATEYDIEWVWIDKYAEDNYKSGGSWDHSLLFRNNASRVSIPASSSHYKIPLLYDEGFIFYRIRNAQLKEDGRRLEGDWAYYTTPYTHNGHMAESGAGETSVNWQASTSYAEEGKRKSVVQYFDGSLRNRQTVTKDNTTSQTVVAETIYDFQGRPAIQVLPSPTISEIIGYTRNFNTIVSNTAVRPEDFDAININSGEMMCNKVTSSFSTASGAAKYYSSSNPNASSGIHRFIPDAEGYPFTETRYAADGRVAEQGGVGAQYQVGGSRSTKYYYGAPAQKDLDALFGTDAGDASHYFKNMVQDANGQFSISYVDMHGRTVATALAGDSIVGMNKLASNTAREEVTFSLLDEKSNLIKDRSIESVKTFMAPTAGTYTFNYALTGEKLAASGFCYNCVYDLEITIVNDCSTPGAVTGAPIVRTYRNISVPEPNTSCGTATGFSISFNETLTPGSYTITKTLILARDAQDIYRDHYVEKNTVKTLQEFTNYYTSLFTTQAGNCRPTCQECQQKVPATFAAFRNNFIAETGVSGADLAAIEDELQQAYNSLKQQCTEICSGVVSSGDPLEDIRQAMLMDMKPGSGQYALITNSDGTNATNRPYNIFNSSWACNGPRYRKPLNADFSPTLYQKENGTYYSSDEISRMTPEEFKDIFRDEWLENLLPYHPEYQKLKKALENPYIRSSYRQDEYFRNIEKFSDAMNAFSADPLAIDSFFNFVASSGQRTAMNNLIEVQDGDDVDYGNSTLYEHGLWEKAWALEICNQNGIFDYGCVASAPNFPSSSSCPGDIDAVWQRFINLYLDRKMEMYVLPYLNGFSNPSGCRPSGAVSNNGNRPVPFYQFTPTANTLIQNGFYPHFISTADMLNGSNPIGTIMDFVNNNEDEEADGYFNEQLAAGYASICDGYIDAWIAKLLQCPTIAEMAPTAREEFLEGLTNQLRDLCAGYTDDDHPLGVSTGPGGTPSFQTILEDAFDNLSPPIPLSALCHPYLIDFPPPYDHYPVLSRDIIITGEQDECFCQKLETLKTEYMGASFDGTFRDYLEHQYGTLLTAGHLDSLNRYCEGEFTNCKYLPTPIQIPAALQCDVSNEVCLSCYEVETLTGQFTTEFGEGPFEDPSTTTQLNYNKAYEKFMNSKTGFNKTWYEYIAFLQSCDASGSSDCSFLQEILTGFYNTYGTNLQGVDCQQLFTDYFNAHTFSFLTFSDIMALYQAECSEVPNVCEPQLDCPLFQDIISEFYYWYGEEVLVNSNCEDLFTAFFNDWFDPAVPFTFDDIKTMYSTVCGGVLLICDDLNCGTIETILSDYHTLYGTETYLMADCQQRFADFFNLRAGTHLSFQEIQALYSACSFTLDVCTPTVSCDALSVHLEDFLKGPSYEDPKECIEHFVDFINSELSTSYTWLQIQQLYLNACGTIPQLCTGPDCEHLSQALTNFWSTNPEPSDDEEECWEDFTNYYNTEFGTTYTWEELKGLFEATCGYIPTICGNGVVLSCTQFNYIISLFVGDPYYSGLTGGQCISAFTNYFNTAMGTHYTYEELVLIYENLCSSTLDVCSGLATQCSRNEQFVSEYISSYGSLNLPQQACRDLFTFLYNQQQHPTVYLTWDQLYTVLDNCSISLSGVCPGGGSPTLCMQLESLLTAYHIIHAGANPSTCQERFTSFINSYLGTSYSWTQIQNLYEQECGAPPVVCISQPQRVTMTIRTIPTPPSGPRPPKLCGFNNTLLPEVNVLPPDPCAYVNTMAVAYAEEKYQLYVDSINNQFDADYYNNCVKSQKSEMFTVTAPIREHHYTLYYYDQAGNLVQTVPPDGVDISKFSTSTWSASVKTAKENEVSLVPDHILPTKYRYNTLNQVTEQSSPDGGTSKFWYDQLGRLTFSQNAKQAANNHYSYTTYDALGRITEVGQLTSSTAMTQTIAQSTSLLSSWKTVGVLLSRAQMTKTVYDVAQTNLCSSPTVLCQQNLRNRVSYSYVQPTATYSNNSLPYTSASYYTYDIHGNVDILLQHYNDGIMESTGNAFKIIQYDYDLISGKVNEVAYQPGMPDQFYHRYRYDAENRLILAETSIDQQVWEEEANYTYYRHGPLARTELGHTGVQGIDYAYTLQGWMKVVNSTAIGDTWDMGGDGTLSGRKIAKDAFGFALHYNSADYAPIHTTKAVIAPVTNSALSAFKNLYNGNIAAMAVNIAQFNSPLLYRYKYDQLNRLTEMDAYNGLQSNNTWSFGTVLDAYRERISYDANGNILAYHRNGANQTGLPTAMDNLTYHYAVNGSGKRIDNKLLYVSDDASYTSNYSIPTNNIADIDNQSSGNYEYDEIGNLIKDAAEGISSGDIIWNVYGKISSIEKTVSSTTTEIGYYYDAAGNRIGKDVTIGGGTTKSTWYVRDASGNVMAVYENNNSAINSNQLSQIEVHLYGSSRLGLWKANRDMEGTPTPDITSMTGITDGGLLMQHKRGEKLFELSNHLGNVLVTVSDRKLAVDDGSDGDIDSYIADVVTANDYYPFGMGMPGRMYTAISSYRYGFNGKENDNEVKGEGYQQDYGLRIYDPRIGKFLSVDPLTKDYPWYTPYQFSGNSPIANVDLDGAEPKPATTGKVEGQSETTSKTIYPPSDAPNDISEEVSQNWYWHSGGLGTGRVNNKGGEVITEAGWYKPEDYLKLLSRTTAARELASESGYYAYSLGATQSRKELMKFIAFGVNDNAANQMAVAARITANSTNLRTSGLIEPSSFNVEDMLVIGIVAKQIIKHFSTKVFYSVQSVDDIARLRAGGEPWPTSATRAHFGPGVYAWGSKSEAKSYLSTLSANNLDIMPKIMKFSMSRSSLKKLNSYVVSKSDNLANSFLSKHSSLFGEGLPHGFQYIQRATNIGTEHFFSKDIFNLMKIH